MWEPQIITFLPISEIGYRDLGRGGAERSECPPTLEYTHPLASARPNLRGGRVSIKDAATRNAIPATPDCRVRGLRGSREDFPARCHHAPRRRL